MTGTTTRSMWRVGLAAALLCAALAPAGAEAQGRGRGGGDGLMLPALLRSANLTPDQQTRMHDILKARRTAARPIVQNLRQAQQDLADRLLASGAVAMADVQPQLDRINQLRAQLLQNSAQATDSRPVAEKWVILPSADCPRIIPLTHAARPAASCCTDEFTLMNPPR